MKRVFPILFVFISSFVLSAQQPKFSTAGFFPIENSGRKVMSMNVAWRFYKGDLKDGAEKNFNDSQWPVVNLPDGIEYVPEEASGGVNYQGTVWYRKHFTPLNDLKGKKHFLHFEGIMGKSKIWINGVLVKEHFGGYLPVVVDITDHLSFNQDNVIAVRADNSNDPLFPPGKEQSVLDFTYFGGIYRDCWLVTHNETYITNENYENKKAGGGFLIAYDDVSDESAKLILQLHLRNETGKRFTGKIRYRIINEEGATLRHLEKNINLKIKSEGTFQTGSTLEYPNLWSPENPYLYKVKVELIDKNGKVVDGYYKRVGIRSIEFKGDKGFYLNGKPYPQPLIGANRHQDFAVVGNAVSNNLHWRDAKKLRDIGLKVIRNAHYPQDPAFMDACDELGLFVIVNTPGWQFWNKDPLFEKRVYSDIRNMVRRDRNRASLFLWEPILNETWYPDYFAKRAKEIVGEEFPYKNSYAACDNHAKGSEYYQVQFAHPNSGNVGWEAKNLDKTTTYFTREWGDNVDDWSSHNSTSRVHRGWGERPMLIQAAHYANPSYPFTSYNVLYKTKRQHVGGALWHSFDHQRGYHPDPFYGGLMDAYRQPKYAYYMFMAQRSPEVKTSLFETGPMVFIANEMTPFSEGDVTVYSNCDEVRLKAFKDGETKIYHKKPDVEGMPSPPIVFEDVYNFMEIKQRTRKNKHDEVYLLAEGFIDGKKVAVDTVYPAYRPSKIKLWLDNENTNLVANGSDLVTVVAAVTDKNGTVKRLNNSLVQFEVEGEAELIGDDPLIQNPQKLSWGTAPVLVRSTTKAGEITVRAYIAPKGEQRPIAGELTFWSVPAQEAMLFSEEELLAYDQNKKQEKTNVASDKKLQIENQALRKELNQLKLKEVERQQEEFGEKQNK
ncbi:glycoside hydrolase family 2 protein [Zhouia amylolytica]|uniref:glycoside hydrolase family 2 protein n=1 Tax=Zhouia amylolytica TaxID=376730 RepID=UPI0020CBD92C|nr:glycoside hydrolase family 2 TIM barrel-domain containing protein [Zhouia amylolytica]MCQ0111836.1 hypothetical protein [Zhouia amylolytica]